jgi:spore coat protein U-like protein
MIRKVHLAAAAVATLATAALFVSELSAQTGDTRTIQVTANVRGSCRFESTPNINFGDLDPALATDKDQAVDVNFKCTKGVAYQLTVGNGLSASGGRNRMKSASGTEYIPYDVTPKTLSGSGKGFGVSDTIQIKGSVKGPDYQNVISGAYADTVTLSIQP